MREWRSWFAREGNRQLFRNTYLFLGDRWPDRALEPQYVLIYGRQSEFELAGGHSDPDALNRKRAELRGPDETLITFDALRPRLDHSSSITASMTATGPEAFAFSPLYCTGPHLLRDIRHLGGTEDALARSVMMSDQRRQYLAERWQHWTDLTALEEKSSQWWARQVGRK